MANTYQWVFKTLEVMKEFDGLSDVVVAVHYSFISTSDQLNESGQPYSANAYGAVSLDAPSGSDEFVSFENLTKDQVKDWVLSKIDTTEEKLKELLDQRISNMINPPTELKIPASW